MEKLSYEKALGIAKKVAFDLEKVDFILLIGLFRIEFHSTEQTLVVESREFDRINLNEGKEAEKVEQEEDDEGLPY